MSNSKPGIDDGRQERVKTELYIEGCFNEKHFENKMLQNCTCKYQTLQIYI